MKNMDNETNSVESTGTNDDFTITNKIIDLTEQLRPSELETEYIARYGAEFVEDLKSAYRWMKNDIKTNYSNEEDIIKRRRTCHKSEIWSAVSYVDFRHQDLYSVTIDEFGGKTIYNYGHSPLLTSENNIRYLLSGMYFYDKDKTRKWLNKLLGPGEKFWVTKV